MIAAATSHIGCGKGKKKSVPGIERFQAGILDQRFYLSFAAPFLPIDQGLTIPIPRVEGALLTVGPDLTGSGSLIQFSAELQRLGQSLQSFLQAPEQGLPDGRPLPDIRDGKLPRFDFSWSGQSRISLYLSGEAFAVFFPISLRIPGGASLLVPLSIPLKDESGNSIGRAYAIPDRVGAKPDEPASGGILVLIPVELKRPSENGTSEAP
jgi:hypothetical protein